MANITYGKTATMLISLETIVGEQTLQKCDCTLTS